MRLRCHLNVCLSQAVSDFNQSRNVSAPNGIQRPGLGGEREIPVFAHFTYTPVSKLEEEP